MDKVYILYFSTTHKYSPDRAAIAVRAESLEAATTFGKSCTANLSMNLIDVQEVKDEPILIMSCYE